MPQHLATLEICEWNNGWRFKYVFFRHCFNNTTAEEQLLQRKHNKKHCFLVVGLVSPDTLK